MTFAQLAIPSYILLTILLGYWLSRAIKTWRLRASFFLTLLVIAVIERSLIGTAATALPAIASIIFFEVEQGKSRATLRQDESRNNKFEHFPIYKWDCRTPLVVFDAQQYLFDQTAIYEYLAGRPETEKVRLCECRSVFMEPVGPGDLLMGCSGDIELPGAVQEALAGLNKAIMECDPICWEQADIAIDVADLRELAKTRVNPVQEMKS